MKISVHNVDFAYGPIKALSDVSLEVGDGEIFGFAGPNGAGKTTIVKLLGGLFSPFQGNISFDDKPFGTNSYSIKAKLGVVSQENNLDRELTMRMNLWYHGRLYGLPSERLKRNIEHYMEWLMISEYAERLPLTVSGGIQRRFIIARALVTEPETLLMDEPTIELDPLSRSLIHQKIIALHKEGKTIFLTSNYVEEVEKLCNNVALISKGKIVESGATKEVISRHTDALRVRISSDHPEDLALLINKVPTPPISVEVNGNELNILVATYEINNFLKELLALNNQFYNLQIRQKTLEEIVLEHARTAYA